MKKIFFILGLLFVAVIAFADYNNYPPMADKYLMPDGSIKTFSGVVVAPPDAGRATKYKTMDMTAAKWLMPDGSLVSALPFSGGGAANVTGLTLGTNATLTVSDAVNATITAPFGSGAFTSTYDGTGVNITATTANITTLTAASSNTTGVMAANVINASGTLTAVPSSTSPIMFGNTTPVNTSTGVTFATADKTQIDKVGAFTNAAVGDLILITGGTGATTGQYRLTTRTSADSVKVDRNIHASGTDITDGAFTVYKDVATISQTDGTNGQMLTGWSHTNKPLQLGGSSLYGVSAQATSKDVLIKNNLFFKGGSTYPGIYFERGNDPNVAIGLAMDAQNSLWIGSLSGAANQDIYHFIVDPYDYMEIRGALHIIDANITVGSGTGVTVNSSGNVAQQVYKVTTTYAAYSDSDTTKGIVIATLPAKTRLVAAYADTTAAYTGGTVSAATLEVGVTAEGGAEILAAHNVLAGAILAGDTDAEMGTSMTRAAKEQGAYMPSFTGTTAVYATIDTTDGNLNALTAGSTTFYLVTERLP